MRLKDVALPFRRTRGGAIVEETYCKQIFIVATFVTNCLLYNMLTLFWANFLPLPLPQWRFLDNFLPTMEDGNFKIVTPNC